MIGWDDIYKVVIAMFPLYVALILGYGSVKWWHMFKPDHCDSINRLNCYFIMPFFTFEFTTCIDPYKFNYRFAVADAISKVIILFAISLWTKFSINGNYPWSITTFSLSTLNNTLIVGVPLMRAMYGSLGENLAIQSSILQFLFWIILLLLMYEFQSANKRLCLDVDRENDNISEEETMTGTKPSSLILMKIVGLKLAKNPNSYACILGLTWALVSNRWNFKMPTILEGSVLIMSRAGSGLFMALQDKIIECGVTLAVFGMLLRFVAAPATMAVGSLVVGLQGDVLSVAIIQAALPQAITAFTYAKEYDLHANVLSTAVIFGTILSIPVLVAYYVVLDVLNV
ncbi:auxin efflux carrier component 5-like isoform X2 [Cynara cardunculus var. scolymus]|uniref:auxin efflux carrier component 5-like isoform X2 n=1 Tax=Cynara cardunculus var. scolymus TaxID=59895 RepID=UPI000D62AB17|nr:auxin efflux carrier component 5-like isoform X2 [Cynara cardunculus var. scolymus]